MEKRYLILYKNRHCPDRDNLRNVVKNSKEELDDFIKHAEGLHCVILNIMEI